MFVLLSDGDDTAGQLQKPLIALGKANTKVYTFGLGTANGAFVPIVDERRADRRGRRVFNRGRWRRPGQPRGGPDHAADRRDFRAPGSCARKMSRKWTTS